MFKDPLASDYIINLVNDGIMLLFDSHNQRLKVSNADSGHHLKILLIVHLFARSSKYPT